MSDSNSTPVPTRIKDLTGQVFSRWTVAGYAGKQGHKHKWRCVCECGSKREIAGSNLESGHSKSCGCLRDELAVSAKKTHGMSHTPEHGAWLSMRQRCRQVRNPSYARYKNRTPDLSFDDFEVFLAEVGLRPTPEHSLDRIDNNLGYVPGNVRWATRDTQANNTSANIPIKCVKTGEVRNLKPACRDMGLPYHRVYQRLFRLGWSVSAATDGLYVEV